MEPSKMTPLEQAYFNSFIDSLCRMLEKYVGSVNLDEIEKRTKE